MGNSSRHSALVRQDAPKTLDQALKTFGYESRSLYRGEGPLDGYSALVWPLNLTDHAIYVYGPDGDFVGVGIYPRNQGLNDPFSKVPETSRIIAAHLAKEALLDYFSN